MKAIADRRSPFARVDLRPLDRIDFHVEIAQERVGLRNLYLTLCQVATLEMDGAHDGFEATRRVLMAKGSVSRNTLDKHMTTLERLGLVAVERRVAEHRGDIPNRYVLVDSPEPEAAVTELVGGYPTVAPRATVGGRSDQRQTLGTLRAHVNAVEKEEEGGREGERADEETVSRSSGESDSERAIVGELSELLAARGQQLTACDRLAVRGIVHATTGGVDPVAAAMRIRRNYATGGKAEHRQIRNVIGVLKAEIQQSTASQPGPSRPAADGRRRRRSAATSPGRSSAAVAASEARVLRVHADVPAALEPPSEALQAAWDHAAAHLKRAGRGTWAWMHSVRPAGTLTTVTAEIGRDDDHAGEQIAIVLTGDPDQVEWLALNAQRCGLVRVLESVLEVDGLVVELAPASNSAAGAAA